MLQDSVTIVIPTFNPERVAFKRCFDSVLNQVHRHVEIIVVDDGSVDDSADWLRAQCDLDPRVVYIRQINQGVSAARNAGIAAATGRFIAFVDADDYVHRQFVSSALQVLSETRSDVVFGAIIIAHQFDQFLWRADARDGAIFVLEGEALATPRAQALSASPSPRANSQPTVVTNVVGALYPVDVVRNCQFRPGISQGEDRLFNFDILGRVRSAAFTSEPWYVYDLTNSSSATKLVRQRPSERLYPTIAALSDVATATDRSSDRPLDPTARLLRDSAARGVLNYLKLISTIAVASVTRQDATAIVLHALRLPNVRIAVAWAPEVGLTGRIFQFCARQGWAALLVDLARLTRLARRPRS